MAERVSVLYNKKPCYDIVFTQSFDELWPELVPFLCEEQKLCIITDSRVDTFYGDEVLGNLKGKTQKADRKSTRLNSSHDYRR